MLITKTEQPVDNAAKSPVITKRRTENAPLNCQRILALDPGTSLMGVAVLERDQLLYYAVKELKRARPACELVEATQDIVRDLIVRYEPGVVAYERSFFPLQKTSLLLRAHERAIQDAGRSAKLRTRTYSPIDVRQALCGDGFATKRMVAERLIRDFPELAPYRRRDLSYSQRYWFNMFDAVAVAVVAAESLRKEFFDVPLLLEPATPVSVETFVTLKTGQAVARLGTGAYAIRLETVEPLEKPPVWHGEKVREVSWERYGASKVDNAERTLPTRPSVPKANGDFLE